MYWMMYVSLFLCTFVHEMNIGTHIIISTATDMLRVSTRHILYIQSDGNYSTLFQTGGEMRLVSYQLGQVEKMIANQLPQEAANDFVRIGRSLIINLRYVYYINLPKQQLVLCDNQQAKYTLTASRDALLSLKELIEKDIK